MAKKRKKELAQRLHWQLERPAGMDEKGEIVSLRELVSSSQSSANAERGSSGRTMTALPELPEEDKATITIKRIEKMRSFSIVVPGGELMGRDEVIREVKARSRIGLSVIDVEQRMVRRLLELAPVMLEQE